ncbi:MAG: hypothetical protein IKH57_08295 [Clostridia bacterium]|nr:hypothetical protein [Clostridia bacterium]MBR6028386.1 hypothetical protein [Clostridia bacterium]
MTKAYHIDWNTNTLTMTKKFAAEANRYGTEAYNIVMDMRSKGFHIVVRESTPRAACPTRITFKKMETILSRMDYADERLEQLHAVMDAGKGTNNQYEYVRRWFLHNYPNFNEIPALNTNCRIVGPRVTLLPEDTEPLKISA